MTRDEIKQADGEYIAHTYGRFDAVLVKGKNATAIDQDGRRLIDFTSGIGVNSLGWGDEQWAGAVAKQALAMAHTSNLYYTEPCVRLAKLLHEGTGCKKVFFANSGAEANEGAIKAARKYSREHHGPGRHQIITLVNSFHGRTVTTLSATGQDAFHQTFGPFTEGFAYVPAGDMGALLQAVTPHTCAIMVELVQGEGGVIPLKEKYIRTIESLCDQKDILLIVDEVQTGVGRTGSLYCYQQYGIQPDIVTSAKGLGGGLPIGAVMLFGRAGETFGPGDHGSTFGGNPVAAAGACVVLERMDRDMLEEIRRKGNWVRSSLEGTPGVENITGRGMMQGIALSEGLSAKELAAKCLEKGLMILTAKDKLRMLPPLTITDEELEEGVCILKQVLAAAAPTKTNKGETNNETPLQTA
ncbi:MAG: aspartate aminotransferase family protein [Oscillospiraceae bacterium]|nr:aspartate aminotransferase family protein [Oscillospiraceae bacterium]